MRVIITGTSTGIGRALAEDRLKKGDRVWGLARSDQSELTALFPSAFHAVRCDVSSWKAVEAVAEQISRQVTGVDALIACAGVQGEIASVITADPERWSETVRCNLDATFYCLRAFYPLLARADRRAKVVAFSGGGATKPRLNFSAYGVAKTGILRLVETAAEELKQSPIDLNAVAPGAINTRLTDEVIAKGPAVVGQGEYEAALKQKASGGSSLEKALGLVDWLLGPKSDGISGRLISAPWDPWMTLDAHQATLAKSDIYTLRRVLPEDRDQSF